VITISKTTKERDVKYKTKEAKGLDKSVVDVTSDKEGITSELDAVKEYLGKLDEQCHKVSTFEDRKARRTAEIAGLKEALKILEGESALIQQSSKHALRGKQPAVQQSIL